MTVAQIASVLPASLLERVALLTPNEHELALVFGGAADDWQQQLRAHPQRIIMTKGADGAWFADANGELAHQAAFRVSAVDTTGAGDTFNGALVTALLEGARMDDAIRFAHAAAAIAVTRKGAQPSVPWRKEIDEFLSQQG